MPNCYANINQAKRNLGITDTSEDAYLLEILEFCSREIDSFCNRHFYTELGTKTFDVVRSGSQVLPDYLTITSLKFDTNGDGTYNETWTENTDFWTYPQNRFTRTEIVRRPEGNYTETIGRQAMQVVALWGYGNGATATPWKLNGETFDEITTTTETDLTISTASVVYPGDTLRVDSEDVFVTAVSGTTVTVERGVNGTTAAVHAAASAISKHIYPLEVMERCLELVATSYEDREDPGKQSEKMGDYSYNRYPNQGQRSLMKIGHLRRVPLG